MRWIVSHHVFFELYHLFLFFHLSNGSELSLLLLLRIRDNQLSLWHPLLGVRLYSPAAQKQIRIQKEKFNIRNTDYFIFSAVWTKKRWCRTYIILVAQHKMCSNTEFCEQNFVFNDVLGDVSTLRKTQSVCTGIRTCTCCSQWSVSYHFPTAVVIYYI